MSTLLDQLTSCVSPERLRDLTLELVRIPSPTGDSVDVTAFYTETVRGLGLPVEMLTDYPESPSTIARWENTPDGPTITLDGHLDTIHADHVPPYVEGERIYGRGAGDMKSGIAAMIEATRVLIENDVRLRGNLILATHSLHEAPVGHMEGLKALIARGDVFVDAAIVAECGFDTLPIRGKGQCLFEIEITREGEVLHENVARPRGVSNPLEQAARLAHRMLQRHEELSVHADPLIGPETYFLGQIHGGDFYNRVPTRAFMNGTYRYLPDKDWPDVYREVDAQIAAIDWPADITVTRKLFGNGLGYQVSPEAGIVQALRNAYHTIVGRELPLEGNLSVSDVNVIAREAGIPVVAHGTGSTTSHADLEWVDLPNIVRTTKVFIATILNYLGVEEGS
jgi:acetylornithine deacetylase/succinyl-diaminopimelate desuccinylase-like protein